MTVDVSTRDIVEPPATLTHRDGVLVLTSAAPMTLTDITMFTFALSVECLQGSLYVTTNAQNRHSHDRRYALTREFKLEEWVANNDDLHDTNQVFTDKRDESTTPAPSYPGGLALAKHVISTARTIRVV